MIHGVIAVAAEDADKDVVAAWLDEHPQSVNDVDAAGFTLLHICRDSHWTPYNLSRLDLVEYLISRGADVDRIAVGEEGEEICPLHQACGGMGTLATKFVVLLIGAGSQINRRVANQRERSPLGVAIDNFLVDRGHSGKLAVVCTLLRAGASLDNCAGDDSAEELVTREEKYKNLIKGNRHFAALKTLIQDVRAAGSWKKYCRRRAPHRAILRFRSLAVRRRCTTANSWLARIVRIGDNGIVWNILSFWRDPDDIEEIKTTLAGASRVVRVYD